MLEQKLSTNQIYTSENDNQLLRKHFKGTGNADSPLLLSIRSLLLGFPITKSEADVIKTTFKNEDVREAFRRKFFNKLSTDAPIGKEADFWFGTDVEVRDKCTDTIRQVIESKQLTYEMLQQAMNLLEDPFGAKVDVSFDPKRVDDPLQIRFLARNKYIGTVVNCLVQIKVTVDNTKDETLEETKARILKNSSK